MKNKQELVSLTNKIDNYYKWFMTDCSSPYDELEWLIKTLLESKHKEDMMQVLNDTYENHKN